MYGCARSGVVLVESTGNAAGMKSESSFSLACRDQGVAATSAIFENNHAMPQIANKCKKWRLVSDYKGTSTRQIDAKLGDTPTKTCTVTKGGSNPVLLLNHQLHQ